MSAIVDPVLFLAFLPAALALNLTPGPDMLLCFAQGAKRGPRAALAASAGISTGAFVHVLLAGLGLGAVFSAFPQLFGAIRWAGAAYLLYLAWQTWRTPLVHKAGAALPHSAHAFRDGLLVNLSNPKVILFVLALVPQFVTADRAVLPQFLACGMVLAFGGFVINGAVGVFSGQLGALFLRRPATERGLRRVTAGLFAALAARMGWEALTP